MGRGDINVSHTESLARNADSDDWPVGLKCKHFHSSIGMTPPGGPYSHISVYSECIS